MNQGNSFAVERLLKHGTEKDASQFKYNVSTKQGDEVYISAIALATNIGDYSMVCSLLNHLTNINIEEGIEAKTQNQQDIRKASPLQMACYLGLFRIVDKLLQAGANPNGQPVKDHQPPLIIVLQRMFNKTSELDDDFGFRRTFQENRDVDYVSCLRCLLKNKADTTQ